MLKTFAVENYRSLVSLVVPLAQLNVVQGLNGSGKSNLYRSLRLLAETAQGGIVSSLAREGGLQSTFWAGPEKISKSMLAGTAPVQGGPRQNPVRLKLGFAGNDFGYSISMGLPKPASSAFALDPEIKREAIWAGAFCRPASMLVDRNGPVVKTRTEKDWETVAEGVSLYESIFTQLADPNKTPEILLLREMIRGWRFYDHFRTDKDAPCRMAQLGTRTPVLDHDGRDLAAAVQTIIETGDENALRKAVSDAFAGATVDVQVSGDGRFSLELSQKGLLRPLACSELSDGTLRYLLWIAALLTPRPPTMMVLNEPETSLHPDLLPALASSIIRASKETQVWVVTHSPELISCLRKNSQASFIELEKNFGQTQISGQDLMSRPTWKWIDSPN